MMTKEDAVQRAVELIKDHRNIEAGWVLGLLQSAPDGISTVQLACMRHAFFRGAALIIHMIASAEQKGISVERMESVLRDVEREVIAFEKAELAELFGVGQPRH